MVNFFRQAGLGFGECALNGKMAMKMGVTGRRENRS